MTDAKAMLDTYPRVINLDTDVLAECIKACVDCAQTCTACADDCLAEEQVADLVKCIRLDLDCADICQTTSRVLSRQAEYDAAVTVQLLETCRTACVSCAHECESHADTHEHCRVCAEACRRCEQACERLLNAIGDVDARR